MRLLRLQDVEVGPSDRVYRQPRMRALIVWLAGFTATVGLFVKGFADKLDGVPDFAEPIVNCLFGSRGTSLFWKSS